MSRAVVLAKRPHGQVVPSDFTTAEIDLPATGDGQVVVETLHVSIDPAIRGWLDDRPSYLPPVQLGEPVRAIGLGRVLESRYDGLRPGDVVRGFVGWREHSVSDGAGWVRVPDSDTARLGVLGMTGLTAWVGMSLIGRPQPGDTVVVSAAAGAVGSIAVQLAKIAGARTVGIAGGPEKCALLTDKLGCDAAVDHRREDWSDRLTEATPDGIDVNFENVGGPVMEAVVDRLNNHARMPLCGLIAGYNDVVRPAGPRNFGLLLTKRILLQGFIALDHADRAATAEDELSEHLRAGRLQALETVRTGLEELVPTFVGSFGGKHIGKLVVTL